MDPEEIEPLSITEILDTLYEVDVDVDDLPVIEPPAPRAQAVSDGNHDRALSLTHQLWKDNDE